MRLGAYPTPPLFDESCFLLLNIFSLLEMRGENERETPMKAAHLSVRGENGETLMNIFSLLEMRGENERETPIGETVSA